MARGETGAHDVASCCCSTICTNNDSAVELDSHDGGLSQVVYYYCCGFHKRNEAYTKIDLAGLESVHVDVVHGEMREDDASFDGSKLIK